MTQSKPEKPKLVLIYKKRTCQLGDFDFTADSRVKIKESKGLDKNRKLSKIEAVIKHESNSDTDHSCCPWKNLKVPGKETEELESRGRTEAVQIKCQD